MQHSIALDTVRQVQNLRLATPAGQIRFRIGRPLAQSGLAPLVVLHGISRNSRALFELFLPEATRQGRTLVVPHFSRKHWPSFQRPSHKARPDQALMEILRYLETGYAEFSGTLDLFGHSGGAQLAHRFAMLYPHRIGRLNIAAAGWYCLPNRSMPYPYGLGHDPSGHSKVWARRNEAMLDRFLALPISVFVGTADTVCDASLRSTPLLDDIQGRTRLERAAHYVATVKKAAHARSITPNVELTELQGCAHNVVQAINECRLAQTVANG